MTRRTTRTIIASMRSITDICDLNSARATSDLLGSLTPHRGQRGASATKSWPHLRQAGRAILTPPVHGGGTVSIHGLSQASVNSSARRRASKAKRQPRHAPTDMGDPWSETGCSVRWASPLEVPPPPAVSFPTMTTNKIPLDEIDALLAEAKAEREHLEANGWRAKKGQPVEDLPGVRGGWTIAEGPVIRLEGGGIRRRYWPARCGLCGEWHLRTPQGIRDNPTSRGCRTCLAKALFKNSAC